MENELEWIVGEINSIKGGWGNFSREDGRVKKSIPPPMTKDFQQREIVRIILKESNQNHIQNIEHS
jgi:hypothetical protein